MSATWWFHCNNCQVKPSPAASKFYLVKCGHVLCIRCLQKAKKACDVASQPLHCICCRKKVLSAEEIGSKMNKRTLRFFKKMEDTMQEMATEMKQIGSFQQMQINMIMKTMNNDKKSGEKKEKSLSQEKREATEKARTAELEKTARKAHDEMRAWREMCKKMEEELAQMQKKLEEAKEREEKERERAKRAEQPSIANFSFSNMLNTTTENSIASTMTRQMFMGAGNDLDSAMSSVPHRLNSSVLAENFFDSHNVTTTPEMLGRSLSRSRSFSSREGSRSPSSASIYIPNRLPSRSNTPKMPSRTMTPKYTYSKNRSGGNTSGGSVKMGSIIPAGNIPRTMRTPRT
ncbi:hypothetical protein L596_007898 [Steinernema carpocapsae]|uniref:RING-type domain-containing protein n=1 Tax=Steinernema carpocapsae TaxID=34508 RepID=A0A4U5PB40_STECR|nr:hypothetical protein L596_007898 [Steinernema carpocapsae]